MWVKHTLQPSVAVPSRCLLLHYIMRLWTESWSPTCTSTCSNTKQLNGRVCTVLRLQDLGQSCMGHVLESDITLSSAGRRCLEGDRKPGYIAPSLHNHHTTATQSRTHHYSTTPLPLHYSTPPQYHCSTATPSLHYYTVLYYHQTTTVPLQYHYTIIALLPHCHCTTMRRPWATFSQNPQRCPEKNRSLAWHQELMPICTRVERQGQQPIPCPPPQ